MTPLVSIIIPTYNRAHIISETLDSVLAQTYTHWECIVVDDGSTDNTAQLMASYCTKDQRFQYHHRPKDRLPGGNAARNYGFEMSKGEYVNWFDDDDIMLETFLEKKVNLFKKNIVITICTGYSVDSNLKNKILKEMPVVLDIYKEYALWKSEIMSPSVMFKKQFLVNKKLFDETLTRGQENEFFSRIFFNLKKDKFSQTQEGLYSYRQHDNTKSFKDKNSYKSDYKKSLGIVSIANLRRGIELKDIEVINYHYQLLIHYFFNAIYNNDRKLGWFLLTEIIIIVFKIAPFFSLKLMFFGVIFNMVGRTVYPVEKTFKSKIFK